MLKHYKLFKKPHQPQHVFANVKKIEDFLVKKLGISGFGGELFKSAFHYLNFFRLLFKLGEIQVPE